MIVRLSRLIVFIFLATMPALAATTEPTPTFSEEERSVATFWEQMGPTLMNEGIDPYLARYHDDFRFWSIQGNGKMGTKEDAAKAWSGFYEQGHKITCTFVEPVTIDIYGDHAFARLYYEEALHFADGKESTSAIRMVGVFVRHEDTWQVLETNMVLVELKEGESYKMCP